MKSFMTMLVRTASMMFTQGKVNYGGWKSYHQITEGLFLGMIPIKQSNFLNEFNDQDTQIINLVNKANPKRPLKLVVSAVELDELEGKGFMPVKAMVTPDDWKKAGVDQHLLSIPDFTADVDNVLLVTTIKKMRKCILENGAVYVHCKAGRSRSAMLCAIYLSVYGLEPAIPLGVPLEKAVIFIQSKRAQVELNAAQFAKAAAIITILQTEMNSNLKASDVKSVAPELVDVKDVKSSAATVVNAKSASLSAATVIDVKTASLLAAKVIDTKAIKSASATDEKDVKSAVSSVVDVKSIDIKLVTPPSVDSKTGTAKLCDHNLSGLNVSQLFSNESSTNKPELVCEKAATVVDQSLSQKK